jgi:hypothetical protein
LERDGWRLIREGEYLYDYSTNGGFVTKQPRVKELHHPKDPYVIWQHTVIMGFNVHEKYEVINLVPNIKISLPMAEFACWDQQGRLAIVEDGKLKVGVVTKENDIEINDLADFSAQQPEEIQSPSWAREW